MRTELWHEQGGLCALCGELVDLDATGSDSRPSIDHRIPRRAGGTNARANLQLAHQGCNSFKGSWDWEPMRAVSCCVVCRVETIRPRRHHLRVHIERRGQAPW